MAWKVLCVLALVATACAAPDSRLMGGEELDILDANYVVSIKYYYPGIGMTIQRCVGSLISSWHVITTAFCFSGANIDNMSIQAGSSHSLEGGVTRQALRFEAHPDYVASPRTADIAVLFVDQPFGITDEVGTLYLPSPQLEIPSGTWLKVSGWGFSQAAGGPQLQYLHSINLHTISQDACKNSLEESDAVSIDENTLCAFNYGRGLCRGDSGVPAVYSGVLIGVGSTDWCGSDKPDVLVNVAQFTSWIVGVAATSAAEGIPVRVATL